MAARGPAILLTFARRGEDDTIRAAVDLLRQISPEVVAIGTSVSAPVLHDLGVADVIALGEGVSTRAALAPVRARRPRAGAVVYRGPDFRGHLKLEALALLVGAPRILRVRPEQPARSIGRARLALAVAGKGLQTAGCVAVGMLVCGSAWCWLRLAQRLAGGPRASRT